MEKNYSLSDIAALMQNRNDDFMGGNGIIILILFFLIFGFGGNAFGGNPAMQGNLTRAELYEGLNDSTVARKLDGVSQGLCDGFYAQNTAINEVGSKVQSCCCETNRNIDAVRYENSRNTCDIVRAIEKDGEATRALINSNTMQALRDKLVEKDQMLQTANFQLSQQAQSANLISTLRPFPKPAYITCSPYEASGIYNPCGCGTF